MQMERGTGKTTFCRALDEHSMHNIKLENVNVRAWYLNDSYASKPENFVNGVNDVFRCDREGRIVIKGMLPMLSELSKEKVKIWLHYLIFTARN